MDFMWTYFTVICKTFLHFIKMRQPVIFTLLVLCMSELPGVYGYSGGAGSTACDSMIPGHGGSPASGAAPVTFTVTKADGSVASGYSVGDKLKFTVTPNGGQTFRGFLLKVVQKDQTNAVGLFDTSNGAVQTICGAGLTHSSSNTWTNNSPLEVDWTAPAPSVGDLEIFITIVQTQPVYWVKVQPSGSPVLNEIQLVTLSSTLNSITVSWVASSFNTIKIFRDNTELHTDIFSSVGSYELLSLNSGTQHNIRVEGSTGAGSPTTVLSETKATLPEPPTHIAFLTGDITENSISVRWTAPTGGAESYELMWEITAQGPSSAQTKSGIPGTSDIIYNLSPGEVYSFTLVAVKFGERSSEVLFDTNTRPSAPTISASSALSTSSIVVNWAPATGSKQTSYTVTYQAINEEPACADTTQTTCTFTVLTTTYLPGTAFTVRVSAKKGPWTSTAATTPARTKPIPPQPLMVVSTTATSIGLRWNSPTAVFDSFTVTVDPADGSAQGPVSSGTVHSYTRNQLVSGKEYTFTVVTVSGAETSAGEIIKAHTKPPAPDGLNRVAATTNSLMVAWSEPSGGDFLKYRLTIARVGSQTQPTTTQIEVNKGATREATFSGLYAGGSYTVSIVTIVGTSVEISSDPSQETFRIKPLPARNLRITTPSETSLMAQWDPPSQSELSKYEASIQGIDDVKSLSAGSTLQATFMNLQPGSLYTVQVVTYSGDQASDPISLQHYTKPNAPRGLEETTVTTNTISVKWMEPLDASTNYDFEIGILELGQPSNTAEKTTLASSTRTHTFNTGVLAALKYTVTLVSRVGTANSKIESNAVTLEIITLSPPVQSLIVSNRSTSSIRFTWVAPSLTEGTPDGYRVRIKKEGDQAVIEENTISATSYERSSLTAGATYIFTVNAMKFMVEGETSELSATITPQPVSSITATYVGTENVELQWVPPPPYTGYDGFEIKIKKASDSSQVATASHTRGMTTSEIRGLQPGINYIIEIITSSNNQFSEAKQLPITTAPEGVTSLELASRTDVSLTITWAASNVRGLAGYNVSINPNDGGIAVPTRVQGTAYTFNSLVPGKIYAVSLTVVTTNGPSSDAVTRALQTKPSPIENLNTGSITETSVVITWTTKRESLQNKFQIIYKKTGDDGNTNTVEIAATNQLNYQYSINSLSPGFSYEIEVTAFSNEVGSDKKFKTFTTVPGRVTNVQATADGSTRFTVTWLPDPNSHKTGFEVSYKGITQQTTDTQTVSDSATSATFTGLFPGERYEVTVKTVSGSQTSSPETQGVVTPPLAPTNVRKDPTRTSDTGFRIEWEYDTSKSRVTQWVRRYAVTGQGWTELPISDPTVREAFFQLSPNDSGKTFMVEIIAYSDGATSSVNRPVEVTLKPQRLSQLMENVAETTKDIITLTYTEVVVGVFDEYVFTATEKTNPNADPTVQVKTKSDERTVTFNDLKGGTAYTIEAVTRSGSQTSSPISIDIYTVPNQPFLTLNQDTNSITVIITRPAGGLSYYIVECSGQNSCPSPMRVDDNNERVEKTVSNLRPNTNYQFKVTAVVQTNVGIKSSTSVTKVAITEEGPPGPVTNLREDGILPYQVVLTWEEPLAKNGRLTGYIVSYTGTKDNQPEVKLEPLALMSDETRFIFRDLTAGYTYIFEVKARTIAGAGDTMRVTITTPIQRPFLGISPEEAKASGTSVESDSVKLLLVDPFVQINGKITAYSVVVTTDRSDPSIGENLSRMTWKEAKNKHKKSWMAVKPCETFFSDPSSCFGSGSRKKRDLNDQRDFTVGIESCDGSEPTAYCNGPLESDTAYYFALRAFTENGLYKDAPFSDPIKTSSGTNWLVIGLIIALVFLLVLFSAVVIFILYKRGYICRSVLRRRKNDGGYVPQTRLTPIMRNSSHRRSGAQDTSRPIKVSSFPAHVADMAKDTDFKFSEEFEDLKHVGREQLTLAADLPINRNKNRFTNILPFDTTRVKLLPTDDEEGSDYINANYVPGFNSKREFIVCQGPLHSTRDDFWRMTWEQNCRAIVMLTKCVEKGREKCDHYWPIDPEPMFYGDLQVTILNETRCAEWVITEFKVAKGEQFRKIKHFHFTSWPDFGTPERPQSLIRFVRLVRAKVGPDGGPVIVHCSAGVGRSGTFCALDRVLFNIEDGAESVDIYGIVHEMRHHRVWMVQTETQYICIHQCLLCVLEGREDDLSPYQGEDNEAFDGDSPLDEKEPEFPDTDKQDDDDEGITVDPN